MKQIVIILFILAYSISNIKSQTNRYDKPASATFNNTYVSPDWNNINKALEYAKSIYDRNAQIVDNMIDAVYNLKKQVDNEDFKRKLDEHLTKLKNLRLGSLVNAELEIKKIDWAIRDDFEIFYSLNNTPAKKVESNNEVIYYYGSYVETMSGGPIRAKPDPLSSEIANTNSVKFVKIKGLIDNKYYVVEFDYKTGYLSKAFLWRPATEEDYDIYYSKK